MRQAFTENLQRLIGATLDGLYGSGTAQQYGARLRPFGSSAAGLHLAGADLDLTLCLSQEISAAAKAKLVQSLATSFRRVGLRDVTPIPHARVPICAVRDPASGLSADVSINNRLPLANTTLLRTYAAVDVRLKQLCYLVKRWAKQRGIADASQNTLSSYGWVLLVIFHAQAEGLTPNLQALPPELGGP